MERVADPLNPMNFLTIADPLKMLGLEYEPFDSSKHRPGCVVFCGVDSGPAAVVWGVLNEVQKVEADDGITFERLHIVNGEHDLVVMGEEFAYVLTNPHY